MKDIKGYEGLYAVTSCGRVWSYRKKIFLKPRLTKGGYLQVGLWKNRELKRPYIHRLVMETYCPIEGMKDLQVNHKDENKEHNYLNNLEWLTCKENINYGSHNKRSAEKHCKRVRCIETNIIYESLRSAADQTGVDISSISRCCNGKRKTCGGFHWEFIEVS